MVVLQATNNEEEREIASGDTGSRLEQSRV